MSVEISDGVAGKAFTLGKSFFNKHIIKSKAMAEAIEQLRQVVKKVRKASEIKTGCRLKMKNANDLVDYIIAMMEIV